jgi:hypothetical protein
VLAGYLIGFADGTGTHIRDLARGGIHVYCRAAAGQRGQIARRGLLAPHVAAGRDPSVCGLSPAVSIGFPRSAPDRSGMPSTWLTSLRWAACRVRTAAGVSPGLTGGRPARGRPGLTGIHKPRSRRYRGHDIARRRSTGNDVGPVLSQRSFGVQTATM